MTRSKRHFTLPIILAFAMAVPAVCCRAAVPVSMARNNIHAIHLKPSLSSYPDDIMREDIINFVMIKLEGSGYVANDNRHGPSKWGILGASNGLSPEEVKNLSQDQAAALYRKNYWDAIGADHLPRNMRLVAYNAAIQFGPQEALELIEQANGDPIALHDALSDKYAALVLKDPKRYKRYDLVWQGRQAVIACYYNGNVPHDLDHYALRNDLRTTEVVPPEVPPVLVATPTLMTTLLSDDGFRKHKNLWLVTGVLPFFGFLLGGTKKRNRRPPDDLKNSVASVEMSADPPARRREETAKTRFPVEESSIFTDDEVAAIYQIFGHRAPIPEKIGNAWLFAYPDHSHVLVEKGRVTLQGDGGIEDTLKYAALAWGNACVISNGTKEFRNQMTQTAQRMVDEGALSSGFTIQGVGTFRRTAPAVPKGAAYRWPFLNAPHATYQPA